MRWESTSRWLTEYNFYTHPSFLIFFKCSQAAGRGWGAFESCAGTEGIFTERQFLFSHLGVFYISLFNLYPLCNILKKILFIMFYLNNIINLYFSFLLFYFRLFSLLPFGSRSEFSKPRKLDRDRFDLKILDHGPCQLGTKILWDTTSVGEENKISFIRVWKLLPTRHVLKTFRSIPKGKVKRGQY